MPIRGGSMAVTNVAAALSAAVTTGAVAARSVSFIAPAANTQNIAVGGSNVEADGNPAYFTLVPGASYTPPMPSDGGAFLFDPSALYVRAVSGTQTLQVVYID